MTLRQHKKTYGKTVDGIMVFFFSVKSYYLAPLLGQNDLNKEHRKHTHIIICVDVLQLNSLFYLILCIPTMKLPELICRTIFSNESLLRDYRRLIHF